MSKDWKWDPDQQQWWHMTWQYRMPPESFALLYKADGTMEKLEFGTDDTDERERLKEMFWKDQHAE